MYFWQYEYYIIYKDVNIKLDLIDIVKVSTIKYFGFFIWSNIEVGTSYRFHSKKYVAKLMYSDD